MADIFDAQKLSIIRRYPTELIILGLISWCTYLQMQVVNINQAKENYILQDRGEMLKAIQETNRVIDKNNTLFETLIIRDVQNNNVSHQFGDNTGPGKSKEWGTTN